MGLWNSKTDVGEELSNNKRAVTRAIRNIDREIQKLETEEKRLLKEAREALKKDHTEATKIFSRDVIRVRKQTNKLNLVRSQLMGIELRLVSAQSQLQINNALTNLSSVIGKVNESTDLQKIQQLLKNFARDSQNLDLKDNIINDSIDITMGESTMGDDDEVLINEVYNELLLNIDKEVEKPRKSFATIKTQGIEKTRKNMDSTSLEERLKQLGLSQQFNS
ncbi:SNF7 family protein [Cryptosporidium muris RN66]|uniref:SNF7 family protein n=1 Tax=Cryptosporidium muris (strain RN66) TaxID=441375 RepID=B6AF30_CRYMR|nr:SNF7 family protein [Cryptosporidium muris RN66]EEA06797.1 SNF7 family protein [Cryptosporidium muris RN66]|eukprot:XP_002141146.1 SNF7 family protein [Cryptosporidium muris RN66]